MSTIRNILLNKKKVVKTKLLSFYLGLYLYNF
uniref:Uncharacterized protein n=1 Tax=Siphoviridae sp. ctiJI15 TaxID=2826431 RepID=A0A8S5NJF9_9CAUD|nr:MAG TPA: hypothetical protein [Siphoviridae sp. ctiJI15]